MASASKRYIYKGPLSGVAIQNANGDPMDVQLSDGQTVDLPPDNQYIKDMVEQGYLTEAAPLAVDKPVAPAPAPTTITKTKEQA